MSRSSRTLAWGATAIAAAALVPMLAAAQQRPGGNNPFPGGTNPDGSLRPTPPVTRLFTQDAYTEYQILAPGSEAFRIRYIPEETRAGATELVNGTRGGSEGSDIEVYRSPHRRSAEVHLPAQAERAREPRHPCDAAAASARGRHRARPHLQDLQGSPHLHDAWQRHRLGPEPRRLPPRRDPAEGLRVHLVEHRRAAQHARRRTAEARLREPERPGELPHDPRAPGRRRRFRRRATPTCSSTT